MTYWIWLVSGVLLGVLGWAGVGLLGTMVLVTAAPWYFDLFLLLVTFVLGVGATDCLWECWQAHRARRAGQHWTTPFTR